jgi:hypothetical protein
MEEMNNRHAVLVNPADHGVLPEDIEYQNGESFEHE